MKLSVRFLWTLGLCIGAVLTGQITDAATLTGIRAVNDLGHTRVVLDLNDKSPYWDVSFDKNTNDLFVTLPKTDNTNSKPVAYSGKGGVLQSVTVENNTAEGLRIRLHANQPVMHNLFVLDKPDRMVIDLFTMYEQKTSRKVDDNITFTRWGRSIPAGRLQMAVGTIGIGAPPSYHNNNVGLTVAAWYKAEAAPMIVPVLSSGKNKKINDADISAKSFSSMPAIIYNEATGYDIITVEPSLSVKGPLETLPVTAVNAPRNTDNLILYTYYAGGHTKTNVYGAEAVIKNGRVVRLGKGDSTFEAGEVVLSGHGKMESAIAKLKPGNIVTFSGSFKQTEETANKAFYMGGIEVLRNGEYVGPQYETERRPRTFFGVTKNGSAVVLAVEGGNTSSVGITLPEGAQLLEELGATKGIAINYGEEVELGVAGSTTIQPTNAASVSTQVITFDDP